MKRYLSLGALAAAGLAIGVSAFAAGERVVTSLSATDLIPVQKLRSISPQVATVATLANAIRTAGSSIATVPLGGSGRATLTNHGVIVGAGTSPVTQLTAGSTGELLVGATGADPAFGTTLAGNYSFTGLPVFGGTLVTYGNSGGAPSHIATAQQTAPALTSCGTSPAIVGTDTTGEVTMGTGSPTGCVITFNVAYTGAPLCTVVWEATPLASQSYAVSNTAITLTQTGTSSNKVAYHCTARSGG
jgi:hypothetical protein